MADRERWLQLRRLLQSKPAVHGVHSHCREARFGALLAPLLDDPFTLFIVSSDFCHWGQRFSFTWHQQQHVRTGHGAVWPRSSASSACGVPACLLHAHGRSARR